MEPNDVADQMPDETPVSPTSDNISLSNDIRAAISEGDAYLNLNLSSAEVADLATIIRSSLQKHYTIMSK